MTHTQITELHVLNVHLERNKFWKDKPNDEPNNSW